MTDSKPLAVVIGASSGIGRELARQFATNGFELMAGKSQVVGGSAKNKVQVAAAKLLPDQARAATHATMTKPEGE